MKEKMNKKAVVLKYDKEKSSAPKVIAKGKGYLAEKIIKTAKENKVPLKENDELIDYLMAINLYEEIPPELYSVIAEILAFIYKANQNYDKLK